MDQLGIGISPIFKDVKLLHKYCLYKIEAFSINN